MNINKRIFPSATTLILVQNFKRTVNELNQTGLHHQFTKKSNFRRITMSLRIDLRKIVTALKVCRNFLLSIKGSNRVTCLNDYDFPSLGED